MKEMQSFLMFFYILDQCYQQCREDDLGGFLGVISPELWEDGQPMDKSIYSDWKIKSNPKTITRENIIKKTYDFIIFYEEKFGYEFSKTKQYLINLEGHVIVDNAIVKAKEMYYKYKYID